MKLWDDEEKKVLLANLDGSNMKEEEREGITRVEDYYRFKTYTKPEEMLELPWEREFTEPYMVAQASVGGTWNDHNAPFLFQVARCNMKCPYCFVPPDLKKGKGKYFSASEIVAMRDENEQDRKTIRISGGEPFLAPAFISQMAEALENKTGTFLWVDTNLAGEQYADVVMSLRFYLHDRFGICGCFKGFDCETFSINSGMEEGMFDMQWKNASTIYRTMRDDLEMESIPLFFYVPEVRLIHGNGCTSKIREMVSSFMDVMQARVHENAPLRTTVLYLKEYTANSGWMERVKEETPGLVDVDAGVTRRIWNEEIRSRFPPELIWIPQYQVPMGKNS